MGGTTTSPRACARAVKHVRRYGLTAPRIGAVRSRDNGATWEELGLVLTAPAASLDCQALNGYFAGGHGDFSVTLDAGREWLYIFFGNYAGDVAGQGIAVARMKWTDRQAPAGRVWKQHAGEWTEPGIGGRVTPVFAARTAWQARDTDAFWGPSVHWNTYLTRYVMLMNRSCCSPEWPQEGIYISYAAELTSRRRGQRLFDCIRAAIGTRRSIGLDTGRKETDKLAGKVARFYMHGRSVHEIVFER